ncbi:c-type cytochrome [Ramlibacter terrae]|uniref:C-type cytochrome n=1 Tax=Ramlibacter terrae TaxID=2732511 RepID=A0ABX6P1G8_9BURK|nr:c-type cytochrome [Ramlibacter terrae]
MDAVKAPRVQVIVLARKGERAEAAAAREAIAEPFRRIDAVSTTILEEQSARRQLANLQRAALFERMLYALLLAGVLGTGAGLLFYRRLMRRFAPVEQLLEEVAHSARELADGGHQLDGLNAEVQRSNEQLRVLLERFRGAAQGMAQEAQACLQDVAQLGATCRASAGMSREHAVEAAAVAGQIHDTTGRLHALLETTQALHHSRSEIARFADQIRAISMTTRLLSLNAAVEAARAGAAGRGFSVIATSVRSLSEDTQQAAQQIRRASEDITRQLGATSRAACHERADGPGRRTHRGPRQLGALQPGPGRRHARGGAGLPRLLRTAGRTRAFDGAGVAGPGARPRRRRPPRAPARRHVGLPRADLVRPAATPFQPAGLTARTTGVHFHAHPRHHRPPPCRRRRVRGRARRQPEGQVVPARQAGGQAGRQRALRQRRPVRAQRVLALGHQELRPRLLRPGPVQDRGAGQAGHGRSRVRGAPRHEADHRGQEVRLGATALLLSLALQAQAQPAPATSGPLLPRDGAEAAQFRGSLVFFNYCMTCHGPNADGRGRAARLYNPPPADLRASDKNATYMRQIVRLGGKAMGRSEFMPPRGEELTDEQVTDVVAYLQSMSNARKP